MPDGTVSGPWEGSHMRIFLAVEGFGGVLFALSIVLVRGEPSLADQVAWINLAVVAVAVLAIGDVIWLMQGRIAVTSRLEAICRGLPIAGIETLRPTQSPQLPAAASEWIQVQRGTRRHRRGCPLTVGKSTKLVTAGAINANVPVCEVCSP